MNTRSRRVNELWSRSILAVWVAGFAAAPARADFDPHVINPQLMNLYWESAPPAGKTGADLWTSDINAACDHATGLCHASDNVENSTGTGPHTAVFTIDNIDSLSQSILKSSYFKDAEADWSSPPVQKPYIGKFNPVVLPSLIVTSCGSPPSHLDDFLTDTSILNKFLQCVEALPGHPEIVDGNNTVFNIWLPPWVLGDATNQGKCWSDNAAAHNTYYVGTACTGADGNCKGHFAALLPTYPTCSGSSLAAAGRLLMHEFMEDLFFGQVCDSCWGLRFLEQANVTQYFNNFTAKVCVPVSGGAGNEIPANPAPTAAKACGAGKNMTLQILVDAARNPAPWDLPNAANGYGGTMYAGVEHGLAAGGAVDWIAGLGHFINTLGSTDFDPANPMMTGAITWTSPDPLNPGSALVQFNGFADGYSATYGPSSGSNLAPTVFDTAWGQKTQKWVQAESPDPANSSFAMYYPAGYGVPPVIYGSFTGSRNCGVANHVVGPKPIGDSVVSITWQGNLFGTLTTDDSGNFTVPEDLVPAGKQKPLKLSVGTFSQTNLVDVYPVVTSISAALGPAAGKQTLTLSGRGWIPNQQQKVIFAYTPPKPAAPVTAFSMGLVAADGKSITFQSPISPIPGAGVGPVQVYAPVDGLWSTYADYLYFIPNSPYVTFGPAFLQFGANCGGQETVSCSAIVYDNNGVAQPAFHPIKLVGSAGVVVAPAQLNTNPGTASCTYTANLANQTVTASYLNNVPSVFNLPGVPCIPLPPLICDAPRCTPTLAHFQDNLYTDPWTRPPTIDPESWADPSVLSIQSPVNASLFTITALGSGSIWSTQASNPLGLQNTTSTSGTLVLPATAKNAPFLHFTGAVVSVSVPQGQPNNWDVQFQFPLDPQIPAGNYRVFGLHTGTNTWLEMKSKLVSTATGMTVVADAVTADPYNRVPGSITGPYALVYYSNLP